MCIKTRLVFYCKCNNNRFILETDLFWKQTTNCSFSHVSFWDVYQRMLHHSETRLERSSNLSWKIHQIPPCSSAKHRIYNSSSNMLLSTGTSNFHSVQLQCMERQKECSLSAILEVTLFPHKIQASYENLDRCTYCMTT